MSNLINYLIRFYKIIIVLVDLLLINVAYIIAFLIKFNGQLPSYNFSPYLKSMPFITISALILFDIYGILRFYRKSLYDSILSITFVVFLLGIITTTITYFLQGFSFPRSVLLVAPLLQFIMLGIWYSFIFLLKKYSSAKRLMIIGYSDNMEDIFDKVSITIEKSDISIKYVYSPLEIDKIVKRIKNVDEVLICPGLTDEQKMQISNMCLMHGKVVYVIPQLFEISLMNTRLVQFEDVPAFMIDRLGLSIEQRFFKRIFDLFFSSVGIIVLLPVILIAALCIKCTSRGNIIYVQERVTYKDKLFRMYKFRTMYDGAEKETGPVISGKDDPRVTPLGKFLRKFRIDEIPQLFNVLKGDLSIVGPRSERPYFVEQYEKDIPEYKQRNVVKAGITGYAQVLGNYDTSAEDKLRYDLIYIKNFSLLFDLKLILRTVKVVFTGNTVYNSSFEKNTKSHKNLFNYK
ncbi:MAG: sugar transferase [Bacillota bacterium]|nr:sugar transferase [Bacillota bacterium]